MIVAIDPGASGGFAWTDESGHVHATPMPETMSDQADFIAQFAESGYIMVIEKVGAYMPGNSGPASVKFARHCGHLEAIAYCFKIPSTQVAPQVWMKVFGALSKDKTERKNAIKEHVARLYPHLKVNLKTADALGILTWAIKNI